MGEHVHRYADAADGAQSRCQDCGRYMDVDPLKAAGVRCTQDHEHSAKCMGDMSMPMEMPSPVTSWADVDALEAAHEAAESAQEAVGQFQQIVAGILGSPDIAADEKAALLSAAAADLPARMKSGMQGKMSLLDRVRGVFVASKAARNSEGLGPDDYAVVGDPDMPSTWKLRIDDAQHIAGAITAMQPSGFRGQRVELNPGQKAEAMRRIGAAIRKHMTDQAQRDHMMERLNALKALGEPTRAGQVVVFSSKAGVPERFAMWASNNFRDREGEVFPAAVIQAAVDRFNARSGAKGFANVWHVGFQPDGWPRPDLTDWGEIEHAAYADGFVLVEGVVTDAKAAAGIAEWAAREPLGTSIEYSYRPGDLLDGVYSHFDFDRVSVLPRTHAANPWGPETSVVIGGKGSTMIADEKQRSALVALYGEEQVAGWEAEATQTAEKRRAEGHAAKALTFELPGPTIRFVEETKADDAVAADEAEPKPDPEPEPVPAWARQLAEQQTAILARLDQTDAAVKAVKDELDGAAPAVGVLGRSVQDASLKAQATAEAQRQDAAVASYRASGVAPSPAMLDLAGMGDWGVAGKIAASLGGDTGNGSAPAGQ